MLYSNKINQNIFFNTKTMENIEYGFYANIYESIIIGNKWLNNNYISKIILIHFISLMILK